MKINRIVILVAAAVCQTPVFADSKVFDKQDVVSSVEQVLQVNIENVKAQTSLLAQKLETVSVAMQVKTGLQNQRDAKDQNKMSTVKSSEIAE